MAREAGGNGGPDRGEWWRRVREEREEREARRARQVALRPQVQPGPEFAPSPAPVAPTPVAGVGVPTEREEREGRRERQARRRGQPWVEPVTGWTAPVAPAPSAPSGLLYLPTAVRPWEEPEVGPGPVALRPQAVTRGGRGAAAAAARAGPQDLVSWLQRNRPVGPGGRPVMPSERPIPGEFIPATMEETYRRLRGAWGQVGGPIEGYELPEVLAAGQGAPRAVRAPTVAEMWAGPTMLAGVATGEEAGPEVLGPAGERVLGAVGAAWHDIKQMPWLATPARTLEAAGKTAFDVLQGAAWAVEELLAKGIGQQLPGRWALPPLAPREYLTEEQQGALEGAAELMPKWVPKPAREYFAAQWALLAERMEKPSIRDYATSTYGESAETEDALSRLSLMGYSSYEAQRVGLDRLIGGEELGTVISGRQIDVFEPSPEETRAFRAYIDGVRRRDGEEAASAAMQEIKETGYIPGSSDLWNELGFQFVLDPLNLLDIGVWKRGFEARQAKAAGRFAEAVVIRADDLADGAKLALGHADDAARLLGKTDEAENAGMLRRLWERFNPLAPTPRAEAEIATNMTYQVMGPALERVESAEEARAMVRALVEDPGRLVGGMGALPVSQAAEEVRPLLEAVAGKVDGFKSMRGAEFDRLGFLEELDRAVADAAMELAGVGAKEPGTYQAFANGFRHTMSEFYLRTPGYAMRNALGDYVTMAWDGVVTLAGRADVDDYLERFGPTVRRIAGRAAGPQVEVGETVLKGLLEPLGEVSKRAGRWIGAQEEGRYRRAFYTALTQVQGRMWAPSLPDDLRSLLDPAVADALEAGLRKGLNKDEFLKVVGDVLGADGAGGLVDVARYLDNPDDLSVGLRLHLEGQLAGVTDVGQVDGVIDDALEMARGKAGEMFASDPTPPGRRAWSDFEAVQDLREEQGALEGLGKAMGVGDDEIVKAQEALADALAPGEAGIRGVEEELAGKLAANFDQDGASLMRGVRAETGRSAMEVRAEVDRLRAEAWRVTRELYEAGNPGAAGMVWHDYFAQVAKLRMEEQTARLGILEVALEQVGRMARGETFEAVVGRPARAVVDEAMVELRALAGEMAARQARLKKLGLEDFIDFDKMLDARRLGVDTAEAETWRLLAINPSRDGLDIITSGQDTVDRLGRAAAAEMEFARAQMLSGKLPLARYQELGEQIWGKFFRDAAQVWDLGRVELAELPLNAQAQIRALGGLGWPAEMAQTLNPEEVRAVLGAGVRWDALVGGPVMDISEAMRGTLADVVQQAGLDLSRAADWGPAEWESVALTADNLAKKTGALAGEAGRLGAAAWEVAGEAAVGAARTVEEGMELAWPQSVDDVARSLGIKPQAATVEDWARVAEYCEQRGTAARMLGEEVGRKSLAAAEAERLPELGMVGGEERVVRRGRLSAAEEKRLLEGMSAEARQAAGAATDWVLGEAGYTADELAGLSLAQKRRLLEEMSEGTVLRTAGDRPIKIGPVSPQRRHEIMSGLSDELKAAAFDVAMEPEAAGAYRWLEMGEEARGVDPAVHKVEAPGMYDAAGWPVVRGAAAAGAMPQREIVERAVGMVPEAERRGRGLATVGYEDRQVWLAERYADAADTARARAGLLKEGARLGEGVDVPVGVAKAATRKEAGIWLLDLVDEEKRVIRTYWFENWTECRAARDEARAVIEAGAQGRAAATGTAITGWKADDVLKADARAGAAGGLATPPTLADAAAVVEQQELAALERIRQGLQAEWGMLDEAAGSTEGISPLLRRQLEAWLEGEVLPNWTTQRAVMVDSARQAADFSLLDYSGGRKRIDNYLSLVFPYTFWKTRSGRNWLLRFAERPGALASFVRYRRAMERENLERGYRGRFEGKMEIALKGLPEWMGGAVFVDPQSLFMPWSQVLGPEWTANPADAENVVDYLYRVSQRLGMRPYGFVEWPLQYAGWIGEKEEIGYVLPHTGVVQALTAGAREVSPAWEGRVPPGGVSIERWLRRGVGVPEQEPYQAYRVSRMLSNMAAERPEETETILLAQELQRLVATGDLGLDEAMGWVATGATGRGAAPVVSPNLERLAEAEGWSAAELRAAQTMLQEAVQRGGLERGLPAATGFLAGVPLRAYPAGEREQVELQRERRGRMWSPLTQTGGREEYKAFEAEHPEEVTRRVMYGALPGAEEYEGYTPGKAWAVGRYNAEKDEVNSTYDEAIDALLRDEPWNKDGVSELEDQRQAELDVLKDKYRIGVEEEEEGYRPWSVWGAGPEEERGIREEEVLAAISGSEKRPRSEDFMDEETGEVDYEAYQAAKDRFFENLVQEMSDSERLARIGREMGYRDRYEAVEALVGGLTLEDVETYWRRNDSALQAAQRVWEETVYGAAWEAYNEALEGRVIRRRGGRAIRGQGMSKGDAYEKFIEGAGPTDAVELLQEIQAAYPERWTEEELREALAGVEFPSVEEVNLLRKPEEEQALARAQDAFWDFYNEQLPPGSLASGAKESTLVQLVLDADIRGTATAEQYERALAEMEEWKAEHFEEGWGTEEEWAAARERNEAWKELSERELPGIGDVLDEYYDLSTADRKVFRKEHPEIGEYYDLRDWFGAQEGNEVWARFYLGAAPQAGGWVGGGTYGGVGGWPASSTRGRAAEERREAEARWPGIFDTLDEYYEIKRTQGAAAAKVYIGEHPELKEYWDFTRGAWGTAAAAGGAIGGGTLRGQWTTRKYGGGGRKYGGAGRKYGDGLKATGYGEWPRVYPPKVYLETPEPWEGALRAEDFEQKTPWLMAQGGRVGYRPWLKARW